MKETKIAQVGLTQREYNKLELILEEGGTTDDVEEVKTRIIENDKEYLSKLEESESKTSYLIQQLLNKLNNLNWQEVKEKPEILTKEYVAKEILKAISSLPESKTEEIYNITKTEEGYDDNSIKEEINLLKDKLNTWVNQPKTESQDIKPILESFKQDLYNTLDKNINIFAMSPLRRMGMGLQGQNRGGIALEWEALTLSADGSTATLTSTPYNSRSVMIFYNGSLLTKTTNYTISGKSITFLQPIAGSEGWALYRKS